MKKYKILYVHHGGNKGGAPRSLAFLIEKLDKEKYEPYVVCHHDFELNKALYESVGAKVIRGKNIGGWYGSTVSPVTKEIFLYNLKHIIPTYIGIRKIVKKIKPDIIHLNSTCLCFAAKSIRRKFPKIPIICHVREPLLDGFWGKILRNNCNKYVDHYVAIEQFDAESLRTNLPTDVIYNFVNFSSYNDNVRSTCLRDELTITHDEKIFLYLARVCPENGAKELAEHMQSLLRRRPDLHLCIVGANLEDQSDYFNDVKKLAETNKNIHLLGFRSDVPDVIASSDVMLVPFQTPHFARSVIEAAAIGKPSIASNIGGVNELIINEKTGFLFDYKSFDGFNDLCERLVDDNELYKTMSRNAVIHAKSNFSAEINASRTIKIYDEYLSKRVGM